MSNIEIIAACAFALNLLLAVVGGALAFGGLRTMFAKEVGKLRGEMSQWVREIETALNNKIRSAEVSAGQSDAVMGQKFAQELKAVADQLHKHEIWTRDVLRDHVRRDSFLAVVSETRSAYKESIADVVKRLDRIEGLLLHQNGGT